jgi:2-methylaconitate cis-trans-isomerase PrpF
MRGGSSKGPFFLASDLPADVALRDRVLLAVMGSPDPRQIDGLGGAVEATSTVGIVSRSERPGTDVDYLCAHVALDRPHVELRSSGNDMLAAAAPFAIERGLLSAGDPITKVTVYLVHSGELVVVTVETPGGQVRYDGNVAIAGVPGTAAPIHMESVGAAERTDVLSSARALMDGVVLVPHAVWDGARYFGR